MSVAYQGVPGAFGHEACLAFLPGHAPRPQPSFAAVAAAVAAGAADFGMLPLANGRAGPVPGVAELIAAWGAGCPGGSKGRAAPVTATSAPLPSQGTEGCLIVAAEHVLPVRLHLMALPGVALEEVRTAVSHAMALRQCAGSLAALGLASQEAENTALAARDLARRDRATLASAAAARIYGLTVLRADMQDDPDNGTRFAVLVRSSP